MGGHTLTRADLAEAVYRKVGLSRTESAQLVEAVLDEICEAIVRGETVKLSSFATFHVRDKNERIGRNPKTGTYELTAWVRSGDPGKEPGWRTFNYWKVRGLDVMPDNFLPRLGLDRATDPLLAG